MSISRLALILIKLRSQGLSGYLFFPVRWGCGRMARSLPIRWSRSMWRWKTSSAIYVRQIWKLRIIFKLTYYLVGEIDSAQRRERVAAKMQGHKPCSTLIYAVRLATRISKWRSKLGHRARIKRRELFCLICVTPPVERDGKTPVNCGENDDRVTMCSQKFCARSNRTSEERGN